MMKNIFEGWRGYLSEDKDDPAYNQETYNAFILLAISSERGGNRDEVKNDIRAIPEVLTVTPVERVDGGVQKQLADYFLSTMKLRVRLPRNIERDILTQELVNDINRMRGVSVRRHTSESGTEIREEVDYQKVRQQKAGEYAEKKGEYIASGPQTTGGVPFTKPAPTKRGGSAPPVVGATGLEERTFPDLDYDEDIIDTGAADAAHWEREVQAQQSLPRKKRPRAAVTAGPPEEIEFKTAAEASPEELGIGDVEDEQSPEGEHEKRRDLINRLEDFRDPLAGKPTRSSGIKMRVPPLSSGKPPRPHKGEDYTTRWRDPEVSRGMRRKGSTFVMTPDERSRIDLDARRQQEMEPAGAAMGVSADDLAAARQTEQERLSGLRRELVAPANIEILSVRECPKRKDSDECRQSTLGHNVIYRFTDENGIPHRGVMAHLAKVPTHLKPGQVVRSGGWIGTMGDTAAVLDEPGENIHLHHEVKPETPRETLAYNKHGARPLDRRGKLRTINWRGEYPHSWAGNLAPSKYKNLSHREYLKQKRELIAQRQQAEEEAEAERIAAQAEPAALRPGRALKEALGREKKIEDPPKSTVKDTLNQLLGRWKPGKVTAGGRYGSEAERTMGSDFYRSDASSAGPPVDPELVPDATELVPDRLSQWSPPTKEPHEAGDLVASRRKLMQDWPIGQKAGWEGFGKNPDLHPPEYLSDMSAATILRWSSNRPEDLREPTRGDRHVTGEFGEPRSSGAHRGSDTGVQGDRTKRGKLIKQTDITNPKHFGSPKGNTYIDPEGKIRTRGGRVVGKMDPDPEKAAAEWGWLKDPKELVFPANMQIISMRNKKDSNGFGHQIVGRLNVDGKWYRRSFNHLEEFPDHVKIGQFVRSGERMGRMGRTGKATGVHLHDEMWKESDKEAKKYESWRTKKHPDWKASVKFRADALSALALRRYFGDIPSDQRIGIATSRLKKAATGGHANTKLARYLYRSADFSDEELKKYIKMGALDQEPTALGPTAKRSPSRFPGQRAQLVDPIAFHTDREDKEALYGLEARPSLEPAMATIEDPTMRYAAELPQEPAPEFFSLGAAQEAYYKKYDIDTSLAGADYSKVVPPDPKTGSPSTSALVLHPTAGRGRPIARARLRKEMYDLVADAGKKAGLPDGLLTSLVKNESGFNPYAVSPVGAVGLGQFMPGTAGQYGLMGGDGKTAFDIRTDPAAGAHASAKYLKRLRRKYKGDLVRSLAAYNWGQGHLRNHGLGKRPPNPNSKFNKRRAKQGLEPYAHTPLTASIKDDAELWGRLPAETRKYINRILRDFENEWAPEGAAALQERKVKVEEGCPSPKKKLKIKIRPRGGQLITSFEVQSDLNPEVWDGAHMHPEVKERLQEVAEEFIEKLDLQNVDIKDIILTGSLANYNWSGYSDLDVHIVVDFRDVAEDEGLVKKYFDAVRANWNRNHDIKVKGFEVELYVQDDDESHTSTGIYSLLSDEWILEPSREHKEVDKLNIFKKARHIMRDIEKVEKHLGRQEYDAALSLGQRTKDKIKKMRRSGLEEAGIYSTENLAFKVLRRGGYMGKLLDAVGTAYDAQRSLTEQE